MSHFARILIPLAALAAAVPASRAGAEERRTVEQKCSALLAEWKDRFDGERLSYVLTSPFVLAGDGGPERLARYRDQTVLAAARALRATFFDQHEPDEPILIFLFESAEPYQRLARRWFGSTDVPHYGFFRRRDRVMLMNVGTGTGTLVHELVHALMAFDFPDTPDWFNEGLASLYEQCSLGADGKTITGHENWRLPALQRAIRTDKLRPLRELIEDDHFYDESRVGLNYAQARYLMYYLQQKGQLRTYYRNFRRNVKDDPTGLKTLQELVEPKDLAAFEKDWRKWVLLLRFG